MNLVIVLSNSYPRHWRTAATSHILVASLALSYVIEEETYGGICRPMNLSPGEVIYFLMNQGLWMIASSLLQYE